jgi:gag-polypeptide of LTR copia-type
MYETQSMVKMLDLKLQLQTSKKRGLTCYQYLQQMQSIVDRLRNIGTGVSDQDLVLYTLQGLGFEYENFVTALSMRYYFPSMSELYGLLLAHEARLHTNLRNLSSAFAVHLTQSQTSIMRHDANASQLVISPGPDQMVLYTNGFVSRTSGQPQGCYQHNSDRSNLNKGRGRQPHF